MTPLTAAGRSVLLADAVQVTAGLELLNQSLTVTADLTDNLIGGSVERTMDASVHGTCTLALDAKLAWGNVLVRPFQTLTANGVSVRFNLGVFFLTTPDSPLGDDNPIYSVQGYDRLHLLQRPVGDTYTVDAGVGYLTAIAEVFAAAGLTGTLIDQSAAAKALPSLKVWPLNASDPTSWLTVLNDLLAAINYRGVWADQDGLFRCDPYVAPAARTSEFTFDTSALTILSEDRTLAEDVWGIPNRWVFIQANRPPSSFPTEGDGIYTYNLPDAHALSAVSRGLVWPRVVEVDAADQFALVSRGNAIRDGDLRVASTLRLKTGPFPAAGHADVFTYDDPDLGPAQKVQAESWSVDLSGDDVEWVWQRVTT